MADRPGLLGTPLGQFGLGAVALVVGGALLFALIGAVSGEDGPEITDQPASTSTATDDASTPVTAAPTTDGTATDPGTATEPTTDPTATEASPTPAGATATETSTVEAADVTIQVLNGSDDSADHDAVVACLEGAGFSDLITSNRARTTYATTAVFYTAGDDNREAAEQVARALGVGSVEEQPGNLSESVPVHVVTGQDGSELC